ncbi:MAG: AAA family ATPase [Planctomycetota bacterium]|jgi:Mrp family chromosome partitioning ATPase|nr:AAA family ATPase [Planctomycetota bacterium]
MSADQAFANLLSRNSVAIPPAKGIESFNPGKPAPAPGSDSALAMQVSSLLDDERPESRTAFPGRENPAAAGHHNHPTEVDLSIIREKTRDLAEAGLSGARIVGRDVRSGEGGDSGLAEEYPERAGVGEDADFSRGDGDAGSAGRDGDELGLSLARKVLRLSYLPLSGMAEFEAGARTLMAGLAAKQPERPSLAVTGAVRGEGRTELAIRLALSMARKVEGRILLVDFDAEKPETATRLGLAADYFALADVLGGSCRLGEALILGEEDNLYVLPARPPERDGDDILDPGEAKRLFEELHRTFNFIIIDCGPAFRADAIIASRQAGAVILAGRIGMSRIADLNRAAEELASLGANVAGMAIIGA